MSRPKLRSNLLRQLRSTLRIVLAFGLLVAAAPRQATAGISSRPAKDYARLWVVVLDARGGAASATIELERALVETLGLGRERLFAARGENATRDGIRALLDRAREQLEPGDGLLLYVAPFLERAGGQYFVPTVEASAEARGPGVELREVLRWSYTLPAAATAVIFPFCPGDARAEEYLFSEARYARGSDAPLELVTVCDYFAEKSALGGGAPPDDRREPFTRELARRLRAFEAERGRVGLESLAGAVADGIPGFDVRVQRFPGNSAPPFELRRAPRVSGDVALRYREAATTEERAAQLARVLPSAADAGAEQQGVDFLFRVAGDASAGLANAAESPDALKLRLIAVEELGRSPSTAAADRLGELARQANDTSVRRSALSQLARAASPREADRNVLRAALSDPAAEVREAALQAIGLLRDAGALDKVAALAAGDPEPKVRVAALQALALADPTGGDAVFLAAASDPRPEVRRVAVDTLGRTAGSAASRAVLLARLNSPTEDETVREAAAIALGRVEKDDESRKAIVRGLAAAAEQGAERVRRAAVVSLGRIGGEAVVPILRRLLRPGHDESVRMAAAEALGGLKEKSARADLIAASTDESPAVRRAAVTALGRLGGDEVVDALFARADDSDLYVKQEAERMLVSLPKIGYETLAKQAAAGEPNARRLAVRRLGEDRHEAAVPALVQMLASATGGLRVELITALSRFEDREAAQPIVDALESRNRTVRWGAVEGLGGIAAPWTTAPLAQAATDADAGVRAVAVTVLGARLDVMAAEQAVFRAVDDPSPEVRAAVARALGTRPGKLTEPALRRLLDDPAPEVRRAAREALFGPEQKMRY